MMIWVHIMNLDLFLKLVKYTLLPNNHLLVNLTKRQRQFGKEALLQNELHTTILIM